MANLEGRILPVTVDVWRKFGLEKKVMVNLVKIDELQTSYRHNSLSKSTAVIGIANILDSLFDQNRTLVRSMDSHNAQRDIHLTPSIADETKAFPADSLLVPVATFSPSGIMDLIVIAHGLFEGAVISYETIFQGKNLIPALNKVLEGGLDVIDLLYGPGQIDISSWIKLEHFRSLVADITAKTITEFDKMLKRKNIKKPSEIKLLASGLQMLDTNCYQDVMLETIESIKPEVGMEVTTDFSRLGETVAWAYGGINIPEFQEPTPLKYLDKSPALPL